MRVDLAQPGETDRLLGLAFHVDPDPSSAVGALLAEEPEAIMLQSGLQLVSLPHVLGLEKTADLGPGQLPHTRLAPRPRLRAVSGFSGLALPVIGVGLLLSGFRRGILGLSRPHAGVVCAPVHGRKLLQDHVRLVAALST